MSRAARIGIVVVSVVIFCYAGLGHVLGRTQDDKAYKSLTVYGEVLQKVQQDYVDDPNMRVVTAGALHGLLESLDTQSSYLAPREYDEYKKKLQNPSIGETGLTLGKRFGYVIVISVLPDSPGTKAGIRSGDIFESIAGFTTRDMSIGQALICSPASWFWRVVIFAAAKPRRMKDMCARNRRVENHGRESRSRL
jgi:carboxyl-terminal processing protease